MWAEESWSKCEQPHQCEKTRRNPQNPTETKSHPILKFNNVEAQRAPRKLPRNFELQNNVSRRIIDQNVNNLIRLSTPTKSKLHPPLHQQCRSQMELLTEFPKKILGAKNTMGAQKTTRIKISAIRISQSISLSRSSQSRTTHLATARYYFGNDRSFAMRLLSL